MKINFDKTKIKRLLKIIVAIIIILLIIRKIYEFCIQYDGKLDKSNPMTRSEVIELLDKSSERKDNYIRTIYFNDKSNKLEQKIFVKDNILKIEIDGKCSSWKDYNISEKIDFNYFPNAYVIKENESDYYQYVLYLDSDKIKDEENYNFEYLGEKELYGRKTVLVKVYFKGENNYYSNGYYKIFIDKETGVVVNNVSYIYNYKWKVLEIDSEKQKVEFNCVTDEDVKRPNTAGWVVEYVGFDEEQL